MSLHTPITSRLLLLHDRSMTVRRLRAQPDELGMTCDTAVAAFDLIPSGDQLLITQRSSTCHSAVAEQVYPACVSINREGNHDEQPQSQQSAGFPDKPAREG